MTQMPIGAVKTKACYDRKKKMNQTADGVKKKEEKKKKLEGLPEPAVVENRAVTHCKYRKEKRKINCPQRNAALKQNNKSRRGGSNS